MSLHGGGKRRFQYTDAQTLFEENIYSFKFRLCGIILLKDTQRLALLDSFRLCVCVCMNIGSRFGFVCVKTKIRHCRFSYPLVLYMYKPKLGGWDSIVCIAICYVLDGWGF